MQCLAKASNSILAAQGTDHKTNKTNKLVMLQVVQTGSYLKSVDYHTYTHKIPSATPTPTHTPPLPPPHTPIHTLPPTHTHTSPPTCVSLMEAMLQRPLIQYILTT